MWLRWFRFGMNVMAFSHFSFNSSNLTLNWKSFFMFNFRFGFDVEQSIKSLHKCSNWKCLRRRRRRWARMCGMGMAGIWRVLEKQFFMNKWYFALDKVVNRFCRNRIYTVWRHIDCVFIIQHTPPTKLSQSIDVDDGNDDDSVLTISNFGTSNVMGYLCSLVAGDSFRISEKAKA